MLKMIFSALLVAGLLLSATANSALLPQLLSLDGHGYVLELQLNEKLNEKLKQRLNEKETGLGALNTARHFSGRLPELAESWVRVSLVSGEWSGVASVGGQTYLVASSQLHKAPLQDSNPTAVSATLVASPVSQLPHTQCGSKHPHLTPVSSLPLNGSAGLKAHSVYEQPNIARADLAELCVNMVDGVCLLAEVEFVFDQLFQNRVDDPQAAASSIINIVEGYYAESFNIEFDVITTEFLSSEVFTDSTDPDVLLGGVDALHPEEDPLSIRALSNNNQLVFESSVPALLHLVTGRNFDGGTAGIAFTDVLCNRSGFAVGASQLVGGGLDNEVASTAIIVAHEMGHNFGAGHDASDNNCASGFLMEPSLRSTTMGFSSCSVSEIDTAFNNLASLQRCFNFPVDVSLSADAENVSETAIGVDFQSQFTVSLQEASEAIGQLSVEGRVSDGSASFSSVLLNGAACSLGSGNQTYSCSQNNPAPTISLQVSAVGNSDSASFQHSVNASANSELVDIKPDNNVLNTTVSFTGTPPVPTPDPQPDPNPNGGDGGVGVSEAVVEESGGGGALNLAGLVMLAIVACLRHFLRRSTMASSFAFVIRSVPMLVCAAVLSACSAVSPTGSAVSAENKAVGDERYTVVQQKNCFCTTAFTRPIKVWVENGVVVEARYVDDNLEVDQGVKSQLRSLEQWQLAIQEWQQRKPNRLDVHYDQASNRLNRFDFDPSAMKSDDEFSLTFNDYQSQQ